MSNLKHVLIIGANFSNKGAEAMMKTVREQLINQYGDVVCYMLCRNYEKELAVKNGFVPVCGKKYSRFVNKMKSYSSRAKAKLSRLLLGRDRPWYFPFPFDEIKKILNHLDAVIDVSGFAYADSWGKPMIVETTKLMEMCKRKGIKFYFLPQAWGSFDIPEVAEAAKRMLDNADGFFARDEVSRQHIANALGTTASTIPMLHDIAFSFNGSGVSPTTKASTFKRDGRLLIGISPNLRVYEKLPGKALENKYVTLLMDISRFCLDKLNADILFIPNEIFPDTTSHIDDRFLCSMLYQLVDDPKRCHIVDGYASAEEIKSYIGELDVLVSSRFHALIFGLLQHKPSLAISWSHKYKELFRLFDLEEFVNESNAINDSQVVLKQLEKLVVERDRYEAQIANRLPGLKSEVDALFNNMAI